MSAVRGIYSFIKVSSGGRTVKLSTPGMSASVRPLSHFIWNCPASSI